MWSSLTAVGCKGQGCLQRTCQPTCLVRTLTLPILTLWRCAPSPGGHITPSCLTGCFIALIGSVLVGRDPACVIDQRCLHSAHTTCASKIAFQSSRRRFRLWFLSQLYHVPARLPSLGWYGGEGALHDMYTAKKKPLSSICR